MIGLDRKNQLHKVWYYKCPFWSEDDYLKWYEELNTEEQALIDGWNKKYLAGMQPYDSFVSEPNPIPTVQTSDSTCRGCPFEGTECNACLHDD